MEEEEVCETDERLVELFCEMMELEAVRTGFKGVVVLERPR